MDKPTTEQQQEPTRPDFARLRDVPTVEGPATDPLAPVFVQPGDDLAPAQDSPPKPRGRHRAED